MIFNDENTGYDNLFNYKLLYVDEKKYYKKLDYIRIVSCLLVLLYHLNIVKGGYLAVCTFFAMTGYLGCVSALNSEKFSLKKYYLGRIKKVYVPVLLLVSSVIIIEKIFVTFNWMNLKPESISVLLGYNNFWQLNAHIDYFTKHIDSPFVHLWFVSILIQFEIIFPIAFLILKKADEVINKYTSLIVVVVLTMIATFLLLYMSMTCEIMQVYYGTISRVFSILWGVCLGLIHSRYKNHFGFKQKSTFLFIMYMVIFVIICFLVNDKITAYAFFMLLVTIISLRLIEYSTISDEENEVASGLIKYLANISYEIYLVQYPVIFYMQDLQINNFLKVLLVLIITFVISIFIHILMNKSFKNIKYNVFKKSILILIIIIGTTLLIISKNNTAEMKLLEEKLNNDLKAQENRNIDFDVPEEEVKPEDDGEEEIVVDEQQIAEEVRNLHIVGIGDSVLLGASEALLKVFPNGYFDGKVSRSIKSSEELFIELKNKGILGDIVVISLANNGDYSDRVNKELLDILEDREIYWMDARNADDPQFNDRFKEFAKDYPNIHIIEWEKISENHPEYFYADGIHLKEVGMDAYANAIYEEIVQNKIIRGGCEIDRKEKN